MWLTKTTTKEGKRNKKVDDLNSRSTGKNVLYFILLALSVCWSDRFGCCDLQELDVKAMVIFAKTESKYMLIQVQNKDKKWGQLDFVCLCKTNLRGGQLNYPHVTRALFFSIDILEFEDLRWSIQ